MLNRRSFLIGCSGLITAHFLSGCQANHQRLGISLLKNSIPLQLLAKFRNSLDNPKEIDFTLETNLGDLWKLLQKDSTVLVTLGDTWLEQAIPQKLIQPLVIEELSNWQQLPSAYQELVKRNSQGYVDPQGEIWGAPYRWGTTMIAYRSDRLKEVGIVPQDWSDLWQSALKERISLPAHSREVIGLTLKKLGYSYNQTNLAAIPELPKELERLNQQVKFYSSDAYLQPLIKGDTWLAVGWSTDIIPVANNYSNIEAVIPPSGTSLWVDLWVKSALTQPTAPEVELIKGWIDFCWQPRSAEAISLLTNAASPVILNAPVSGELTKKPLVIPSPEILSKSEFLLPLNMETLAEHRALWEGLFGGQPTSSQNSANKTE
ncbi:extracellular solute-binding protein [Gloeocapsa sp. PCC 73106]|uniref:extracellular solute-binding protein n=1 Tax=Gloeocapsa sp. PCC 73106 TaxID=102232 RepID=UPI0002ABB3AD|nr:extracellular solute-binding protein [Gloeocapsa sp. PCC 73106]ELR96723.1 spermidine/putrescine-binding periplasmic protein [Gloeocapsa sp. PCC 73106]